MRDPRVRRGGRWSHITQVRIKLALNDRHAARIKNRRPHGTTDKHDQQERSKVKSHPSRGALRSYRSKRGLGSSFRSDSHSSRPPRRSSNEGRANGFLNVNLFEALFYEVTRRSRRPHKKSETAISNQMHAISV